MTAYSEEVTQVSFSGGVYSADLPSAIPENYTALCNNAIPTGTSVENRFGIKTANVNFNETVSVSQVQPSFTYFGPSGDEDNPIMIWGEGLGSGSCNINLIREGSPFTDPGGGSVSGGYFNAGVPGGNDFIGAVSYNDRIYLFTDTGGVHQLTSINWGTSSYTTASIPSSPSNIDVPPIHFVDRLWTGYGNKLMWTDAISGPGAYPETWNTGTNFLSIIGANGPGKIYKLIPMGSRIYIFTSAGLYSLTIAGNPSDWYLRPIDENAIVNSYECAFEVGGLIYYVTIYGVFVTNGSDAIKLSGPIENYFLAGNFEQGTSSPNKRSNIYRINYVDGGLIVSISNFFISSGTAYYDTNYCFNFYTRLANIAWSNWQYNTEFGDSRLVGIESSADSVESYINKTPLTYFMCLVTDSVPGAPRSIQRQVCVYDGLRDEWVNPPGGGPSTQENVVVDIKSRYFEGPNNVDIKTFKYGYLDIYSSDPTALEDTNIWNYIWVTESDTIIPGVDAYDGLDGSRVSGLEFNSIRVQAGFKFRICQFQFSLDTNNQYTFKVKDLTVRQHTERDGPYSVQ